MPSWKVAGKLACFAFVGKTTMKTTRNGQRGRGNGERGNERSKSHWVTSKSLLKAAVHAILITSGNE